jgi:spore coat polysaccharide biosynthesis protein SpsF
MGSTEFWTRGGVGRMTIRVAAIVQARMKSTRLPGKVLRDLAGRPMLWHVLYRLKACQTVHEIAVAASTSPEDDAIAAFCEREGVKCVRGPEDDVLARYVLAAQATGADIVVRVTSDAPLIDASFVDYLVRGLIDADADFVMMADGVTVAHEGADPFSRRALDKLAQCAATDPVAKEHVSAYFKQHPEFVKIAFLQAPQSLRFEGARLSVDTPADAAFIEAVYDRLNARAGQADLGDLIALLRREPGLLRINAHVKQKAARQMSGTIIMRCDGGAALGFGHVKRSLAIARELRDQHGFGVHFALMQNESAQRIIESDGFTSEIMPSERIEAVWLSGLIARVQARAVLFDTRLPEGAAAVTAARRAGCLTAVIDDAESRRLAAELAFYPPVPQAAALDWTGAQTQVRTGWEWAVLSAPPLPRLIRLAGQRRNVLITMGGSDPLAQTVPAARAAAAVLGAHETTIVLGPDVRDRDAVVRSLRQLPGPMTLIEGCHDLRPHFANADVAIAMFGVTAYELAAHGVPGLYLTLTDDHAHSAGAFTSAGLGRIVGAAGCGEHAIADALRTLLADSSALDRMHANGLAKCDGRGAERIASLIAERLSASAARRKAG